MSKQFKKAENNSHLRKLRTEGLSEDQIAKAFGVSRTALSAWLRNKKSCPYWTKIAAEGILRRLGQDARQSSFFFFRCSQEKEANLLTLLKAFDADVYELDTKD